MVDSPRIIVVGAPPAIQSLLAAAARRFLPSARMVAVDAIPSLPSAPSDRALDLVVLHEPGPEDVTAVISAADASGRSRWGVVVLAAAIPTDPMAVGPDEFTETGLGRILRSALLEHGLRRENQVLRGDLRTTARRVRHDMVTPAGCIITSATILEHPPVEPKATATMIDNIRESAKEASALVDRVSLVLAASAEPLPRKPVAMGPVVAGVLDKMSGAISSKGATVASAAGWPTVNGVATWLPAIWSNLLANALRYGGSAPQIRLAWSAETPAFRFSVFDRGPGVPAAMERTLFRPFERLHADSAPGLGLPIVQRLVALQGGQVGYRRHENAESEFYFTLAAADGPSLFPATAVDR